MIDTIGFKKVQLTCINNAIDCLCGVVDVPAELKYKKIMLEREIHELQFPNDKKFDKELVKE